MEAVQTKSKRADMEVSDDYMHAVALKSLLATGEYETETRDWTKLPKTRQTWTAWKTTFWAAYVANVAKIQQEQEPPNLLEAWPKQTQHHQVSRAPNLQPSQTK